MSKKVYILNTVGITLADYKREDLKVGMSVTLDAELGDRYAKRGFLTKANAVATKSNNDNKALKKENADLKKELTALKKENADLKKPEKGAK